MLFRSRFGSYQGEVNHLKNWLATRLSWMDGQFAPRPAANRAGGTSPAGTTVTLSAPLRAGQKIYYTLNGSDPRPQSEGEVLAGTTLFGEAQAVKVLAPADNIGADWQGGVQAPTAWDTSAAVATIPTSISTLMTR